MHDYGGYGPRLEVKNMNILDKILGFDVDEEIKAIFGEEPKPEGKSEAEEDGQKDAE